MTEGRACRRSAHTWSGQDGVVTVWTIIVVAAAILMVGLVLDGGLILRSRSSTFDLASEASRTGAQALDQTALAKGEVRIDPAVARQRVISYLRAAGAVGTVDITGDAITVRVHRVVRLQILRPSSVSVDETATAIAHRGR
jgi:Flp pilus assembly protein TadG